MRRNPTAWIGLMAGAMLVVGGCTSPDSTTEWVTETPDPDVDKVAPPEPEHEPVWPLTGVATEDDADAPAVSIKVENSPGARPQEGLQQADIVWEELVEGGITRFVATYHSDIPEQVGPIRSIRPMDAPIAGPIGGVFAFSGGQDGYQQAVADTGLVMVSQDGGDSGFHRNPERAGDHQLFGDPQEFLSQADEPPQLFDYAESAEESSATTAGEEATQADPSFPSSQPGWAWQEDGWMRSESGEPATDGGEQIHAANVLILAVDVTDTGDRDAAGTAVLETDLTGSGELHVLSDGHVIDGKWDKGGAEEQLDLTDDDGEPIELAPGNTWVELVPNQGGSISVE